jgi:hypothetical protein
MAPAEPVEHLPLSPVASGLNVASGLPNGSINNSLASQIANTAIGLTTGISAPLSSI